MIPFRKSLAFRLLLLSCILLALPLLVDSFIIVQKSYEDATSDAKSYLSELVEGREIALSELQPVKRPTLVLIETFLGLRDNFPEKSDEKLTQQLRTLSQAGGFDTLLLARLTPEGRYIVVASNDPPKDVGRDDTDYVTLTQIYAPEVTRNGYFNYLSYDEKTFEPYFIVGRVVYSLDEKPLGIIVICTNIKNQIDAILEPTKGKYHVSFALLLPDTMVFAASDPALQFQSFSPIDDLSRKIFANQEQFRHQTFPESPLEAKNLGYPFMEFMWDGVSQIAIFRKLSTSLISLLAYTPKQSIFSKPLFEFLDVYASYIAILLIGGFIAYFVTRRLARPMFELGGVMREIQKGDLEKRYRPDPLGYEINTVGEIFNNMIETLLEKQGLAEQERVEKETYAQQMRIGQQVQRRLLVEKMPKYPGIELAERYIPAKEVGGDFYDLFVKTSDDDDTLVVTIADASGKGVRACFYSLGLRSMLRTYAKECKGNDVGKVLSKANALFCKDTGDTGMFVTVFMSYYNHHTKELSYFSCGHNPAYLRRANKDIVTLDHMGCAIGVDENMHAHARVVQLEKGDLVLFYTDGIVEAHDSDYRMFSEERLMRFLREEGDGSASQIADKLLEEVRLFVGAAPQHDDMTLVVMKVK